MAAAPAPSQRDVNDVQPLGTMQPSPPSSPARPSARSQQIAVLRREMDEEADGSEDVMMDAELDMSFGMDLSTPTQSQEEEEIAKMDPPDWVAHVSHYFSSPRRTVLMWCMLIICYDVTSTHS